MSKAVVACSVNNSRELSKGERSKVTARAAENDAREIYRLNQEPSNYIVFSEHQHRHVIIALSKVIIDSRCSSIRAIVIRRRDETGATPSLTAFLPSRRRDALSSKIAPDSKCHGENISLFSPRTHTHIT